MHSSVICSVLFVGLWLCFVYCACSSRDGMIDVLMSFSFDCVTNNRQETSYKDRDRIVWGVADGVLFVLHDGTKDNRCVDHFYFLVLSSCIYKLCVLCLFYLFSLLCCLEQSSQHLRFLSCFHLFSLMQRKSNTSWNTTSSNKYVLHQPCLVGIKRALLPQQQQN